MKRIMALLVVLCFVVGCGGGGGSSDQEPEDSYLYTIGEPYLPENYPCDTRVLDDQGHVKKELLCDENNMPIERRFGSSFFYISCILPNGKVFSTSGGKEAAQSIGTYIVN